MVSKSTSLALNQNPERLLHYANQRVYTLNFDIDFPVNFASSNVKTETCNVHQTMKLRYAIRVDSPMLREMFQNKGFFLEKINHLLNRRM